MISDGASTTACVGGRAPLWSTCAEGVVAIHGEVDVSTRDLFATMVRAAVETIVDADRPGAVHVDLGGVDFIDVGGARVLVIAGSGRDPDSPLVLHRPPALLARILEIGWPAAAGLRLESPCHGPAPASRRGAGAVAAWPRGWTAA